MQRLTSQNRSVGDTITAERLQQFNEELDRLFKRLSNEDLSLTYNISKQLTQIIDKENSITINLDRSDFADPTTPRIYIQEVGDPNQYTVTYASLGGPLASISYGP